MRNPVFCQPGFWPHYLICETRFFAKLKDLEELSEAIASYDEALAIKPDYHEAWSNRGVALKDLVCRLGEAIAEPNTV